MLDLGAGTGKLTRVLGRAVSTMSIAVEPLDGMRDDARAGRAGRRDASPGSAERIPLRDESVDGVFAAQAFHWFDKPVAVPEIARVLRPGGVFALVWNEGDDDRPASRGRPSS